MSIYKSQKGREESLLLYDKQLLKDEQLQVEE